MHILSFASHCSSRLAYAVSKYGRLFSSVTEINIERFKNPTRGGQNLSARYRRLENSLRGKQSRRKALQEMPEVSKVAGSPASVVRLERDSANFFRGFKIPSIPKPPESDECCMSGCTTCVYDLYQESLTAYKESLASLRAALQNLEIPESEWPSNIQRSAPNDATPRPQDVSLSPFQELERRLQEKREQLS